MIRIRFVTSDTIISDTIRKFEYGFWASHAEAVMLDGKSVLGAYLGIGVEVRPIGYDTTLTKEEIVTIPATPEQEAAFYGFLNQQIGKPYDERAILGLALQRDWADPGQWFCSELQAAALCACGIFPSHLATQLNHVTPRDLLLIVSGRVVVSLTPDEAPALA